MCHYYLFLIFFICHLRHTYIYDISFHSHWNKNDIRSNEIEHRKFEQQTQKNATTKSTIADSNQPIIDAGYPMLQTGLKPKHFPITSCMMRHMFFLWNVYITEQYRQVQYNILPRKWQKGARNSEWVYVSNKDIMQRCHCNHLLKGYLEISW